MLAALPLALACYGTQPCQTAIPAPDRLVRSASPASITAEIPHEVLIARSLRPLRAAVQRVAIRPEPIRAQAAIARSGGRTTASKAMFVFLGVIAGCYAGAYLGEAMEENGGFPGMAIGAALGGVVVWTAVK